MGTLPDTFPCKRTIIQSPSDIVMAAQVIQEHIILRKSIHNIKLLPQKADISGSYRMPCRRHRRNIIKHMALRLLHSPKIRNHLFWLHHYFTEKQDARTDNLTNHTHHTYNRMYLGKIPALRIQFLPYIWDGVNPDDIDSLIRQEQEIIHHLIKYPWILVIQIPLVRIE